MPTLEGKMLSTTSAETAFHNLHVESSTTSSIHLSWGTLNENLLRSTILAFQVHYQKEASKYVQYGPRLPATANEYDIKNLVADTFYKICLVIYQNNTVTPDRECVDASTSNWRIPVSISVGSSIGAVLALFLIMLIVVAVARCPFGIRWHHNQRMTGRKYDSMSSHFHYDFSDTLTHEREDDFISDHSDNGLYKEGCNHSSCYTHPEYRSAPSQLCNGHHHHQVTFSQHPPTICTGARPKVAKHCQKPSYLGKKHLMSQYSTDSEPDHVTLEREQQRTHQSKLCDQTHVCFGDDNYNLQMSDTTDVDFHHSHVCCARNQNNDYLNGHGPLSCEAGGSILLHKAPSLNQIDVSSSDSGYRDALHQGPSESFEDDNAFFSATENFSSDLDTNDSMQKRVTSDEYEMSDLSDKTKSIKIPLTAGSDQSELVSEEA
ncbi:uncharacterized protein LOC133194118 [Saccostrea echinata]|uniref:uncharacterized protein LOC133194118 n=1 Tax=Saccostrea echinata TaxID=191078 RepID=UPI002A827901|nr:uncharacterized protein LOC133194118 [Saccostrea echinata]XP_061186077.1 uncharacterized protein LOC133194118 [Saccostrea echinata]XP_061186078.1 uncharacterized protein LOC133194118 [Saccostrea echinata]